MNYALKRVQVALVELIFFFFLEELECYSIKVALDDFLHYVQTQMHKHRCREATLVSFHAEHIVQLLHSVLLEKMKRPFLENFRGYAILEEEVRKNTGVTK
jgi:hypothetical protein